jgi:transposase
VVPELDSSDSSSSSSVHSEWEAPPQQLPAACGQVAPNQPQGSRSQQYRFSLIAAITPKRIVAAQVIEGTTDASVFENFIYALMKQLRREQLSKSKQIVLFLDNARVHYSPLLVETAQRLKISLLFSAQYSPWLMPVEQLHNHLKRQLNTRSRPPLK